MAKRTGDDYAKMSSDVESGNYTIRGPIEAGTTLRMGRPAGDSRRGASPTRTVRLAADLDNRLVEYAEHAHVSPSEVMRRALDDYLRRLGA